MADDKPKPDGVFISCVSDEFEKAGAPFPGLRGQLRAYLARTRINVRVQEDFPQAAVDTVKKLDDEIRPRAVVIHLIGEKPGAMANAAAVAEYLKAEPNFLANHPDLRAALGDFSGISYTQWEAFMALHHGIPLLVYATDKASAQQTHLDRLKLGRRYAEKIASDTDLLGQLIGDLHNVLPIVPQFTHATVNKAALDGGVAADDARRLTADTAKTDPMVLLETLKQLPGPWFEQLVFKFDHHNAVPNGVAQSTRAIELLKVLRMTERGCEDAAAEIARLKGRPR